MNVLIQGSGVAALCCARLLQASGHKVHLAGSERARLPVILLGERALTLLRDLFADPDLLRTAPVIRRRTVAWGSEASASTLDHFAVVVSEQVLLESLKSKMSLEDGAADGADWTIFSARPLRNGSTEQEMGLRRAFATPVSLAPSVMQGECSIESVAEGWLFLVPDTSTTGWLLSVGSAPESLLPSSRVVAGRVGEATGTSREFPASPRITTPICGEGWMACGSAAVSFDPICGDGTAYAAREAILTSAVLRASEGETDTEDLLAHYRDRVNGGFIRHLALCRDLYSSGHDSPWWREQVLGVEQGLRWCSERLAAQRGVQFQLHGFDLSRVAVK